MMMTKIMRVMPATMETATSNATIPDDDFYGDNDDAKGEDEQWYSYRYLWR